MKIDTIIEKGKFIRTCQNPEDLAYFEANQLLVADAYKLFRFEWTLGRDGKPLSVDLKDWVIHGSNGQEFEYGEAKLGFSMEGSKRIEAFKRKNSDWAICCQNGDGEANFWCPWSWDNFMMVSKVLKLVRRRRLEQDPLGEE